MHPPARQDVGGTIAPRRAYAVVACAAATLLALLTWQVAVRGPLVAWDWPLHAWVDPRQPDGLARTALDVVANVGGQRLYTVPVVLGVAVWVSRRQGGWRPLAAIAAGLGTVFVVGYAIKLGLGRSAPATGVDLLHAGGQAFPSGHTANATLSWIFVVVILLGRAGLTPSRRRFRAWLVAASAFVVTIGLLMAVLDYHWLSDIPGGWLLGVLALMISLLVLESPASRVPGRGESAPGDGYELESPTS